MAVGAVSEKIDGFHDACAARGLSGTQGVIIPRANVSDLALRPDVVEACRAGRFRVRAVDRIEEALSLLTGEAVPASAPGEMPAEGTLLHRARAAVERLWLASLHPATAVPPVAVPVPGTDAGQAAATKPSAPPPAAADRTD